MDEAIIKFYRRLLKEDFPNAGELVQPTIFLEAIGGKLINCGNTGNYMQLYLYVVENRITNIKYLCSCEPVANVAVEVFCTLVKEKTLVEVAGITEELFFQVVETRDEGLGKKARGLLDLLAEGIIRYKNMAGGIGPLVMDSHEKNGKESWDGVLST